MRPKNTEKEDAIRNIALQMIAEEGLENLSMQRLAKAANISPRTIYIKYENKEDLLITLYLKDVLKPYEEAVLSDFDPNVPFAEGMKTLWQNGFRYLKDNKHAFMLMRYGKSSPLLNKALQREHLKQGDVFSPVMHFLSLNVANNIIKDFPHDVHRALLFSPFFDLMTEYFDHLDRPVQIITEEVLAACCESVIKGMLK